jgi:hypothetical protein
MNRPKIIDRNIIAMEEMASTYRDNFNHTPPLTISSDHPKVLHYQPPFTVGEKLGHAGKVLCAGTTKLTYHIPGYKGHIPENLQSRHKLLHAVGSECRTKGNNLRLTQRGMGCIVGYTGEALCSRGVVILGFVLCLVHSCV